MKVDRKGTSLRWYAPNPVHRIPGILSLDRLLVSAGNTKLKGKSLGS